ncbi:hypothetical protein JRO89_XS12G0235400 [Xanthoceras sorbifolium]|uniref:KHG/KDPG aldolase n=1 Tax=Xanthoceras sorbifolium TaxID=99658 RepID=A0ABQ8HDI5_9ROSI|nr:hypothetical protein JRO89_XS12G0235400 [Xanthoceras sorbifolium]
MKNGCLKSSGIMAVTSFNNAVISSPMAFCSSFRVCCSSSTQQQQLSSSPPLNKSLQCIHDSAIIACLRANSAELAIEAARAAISGGISVLEIVMSTPGITVSGAGLSYNDLRGNDLQLLVGTVLNVEDAKNATNAGAKFLMSPATVKDIMEDVRGGEVLYIPGVMTPTEILSAHDAGAKIVKVYPVSALGGIQYITALKKPFPHIQMVASQGITIDSIGDYIAQGATSVVLSDAIFNKEAMDQYNFDKVYQLARLAALQGREAVERLVLPI